MRAIRVILMCMACLLPGLATAEGLTALARLDPEASGIRAEGDGVSVILSISQPVPWRVRVVDAPPRLVVDAQEVDWGGLAGLTMSAPQIAGARGGVFRPGWSRLVLDLAEPMGVTLSEMVTAKDGTSPGAVIRLRLMPVSEADFAAAAALPEPPGWSLPTAADLTKPPAVDEGQTVVILDPGHGGIDPGAERDGLKEADLMLTFARELKELLLRDGRFRVVLTREEDVFVPLETRISIARRARGHIFLSLHADALAEGEAQGATVYTLSEDASDEAAAILAERHDRDDLLAGIDLSAQDDQVAAVLMDMARTQTEPRTERLAGAIVAAIKAAELRMHRHPRQTAAFSVLKSPEIPSVLLELGFLSSSSDMQRLGDARWRAAMAEAVRQALLIWADEDRMLRALRDG